MLYAEFYDGQGLGNQLWTYVSLRCLAEELGYDWTIFGSSRFKGKDFIELDGVDYDSVNESALGVPPGYMPDQCLYYIEQRKYHPYYLCDISDFDSGVLDVSDNTKIEGYFQSEKLIGKYKKEIRQWVKLVEADVPGVNLEKTLILNVRGGEYKRNPVLLLTKKYWRNVIEYYSDKYDLKSYKVVTDDLNYAGKIFGESNVLKLDVAQCYTLLSKAHYLGLSNSSFAFFPVWLSNQSKSIIAPKYWARHNVSSGFWCRSDNLYKGWKYLDNVGQIYDYESCLEEMNNYVVDGCLDHLDESGFIFKLKTRRIFYGEYMSRLLDYICIPFRR